MPHSLPSTTRALVALVVLVVALGLVMHGCSIGLAILEAHLLCPALTDHTPTAAAAVSSAPSRDDLPPAGSWR
jgi:hypothetical protein